MFLLSWELPWWGYMKRSLPSLRIMRGGQHIQIAILELNKVSPSPPTLFGIYIDKLEKCLEEASCISIILARIVIILLLYANDIVLMARCHFDLNKELRILKDFYSNMGMIVNTNKTKIMIIKSKKDTSMNFIMIIEIYRKWLLTSIS